MAALLGTSSSCYFTLSGGCWVNYSATPQQFLTKQAVCGSPVLSPLTLKVDRPLGHHSSLYQIGPLQLDPENPQASEQPHLKQPKEHRTSLVHLHPEDP